MIKINVSSGKFLMVLLSIASLFGGWLFFVMANDINTLVLSALFYFISLLFSFFSLVTSGIIKFKGNQNEDNI